MIGKIVLCIKRDLEYWCLGKIMLKYLLVNIVYGE